MHCFPGLLCIISLCGSALFASAALCHCLCGAASFACVDLHCLSVFSASLACGDRHRLPEVLALFFCVDLIAVALFACFALHCYLIVEHCYYQSLPVSLCTDCMCALEHYIPQSNLAMWCAMVCSHCRC
jgi:hypothetical protein